MSLIEAARAAQRVQGPRCSVSLLDPATVAEVNEALADRKIYATTVSVLLKEREISISPFALNWHRNRKCSCPS